MRRLEVSTNYDDDCEYDCDESACKQCGLRFSCFTTKKVVLGWDEFYHITKGKRKPNLKLVG